MLTEDVGYHVLKHCKRPFIEMPGGVAIEEVPRILTANQYMMAHGYVPDTRFPLNIGGQMKFFYTTKWNGKTYDKIILYFSKEDGANSMGTDQEGIVQNFNNQLFGATLVKQTQFLELLETIDYEVITTKLFDVGDWTRATGPTDTRKFRNKLRALKGTVN